MAETHQKLSDLHARSGGRFGKFALLEEVYPQVAALRYEVSPRGLGGNKPDSDAGVSVFTEQTLPPVIDCPNPICFGGGFHTQPILDRAVRSRLAEVTGREPCQGYEGSPKGRRRYRTCLNSWQVNLRITYKP